MFNLTDITDAILDTVIEAIKSDLEVTLRPEFARNGNTMTMEVYYAGVTLRYESFNKDPYRMDAVWEALHGGGYEDEYGDPRRDDDQPWSQYVYIEDGADPFLDIARGSKEDLCGVEVTGTPWMVMNHAMKILATWALQAGMDDLQKR